MCQACTFGIKAAGNDAGASLGEVRGPTFFCCCPRARAQRCAGPWAATATAWALLSIIGTLGCHRPWQSLYVRAEPLGRSTLPRHYGGQWPQWQWQSSCRALLK